MRGFLAKLCKKNGIAKRIVSMSLALLMVLSTLQALPAGILVANAAETPTFSVTDEIAVKIGETSYSMKLFPNVGWETVVALEKGSCTGTVVQNGSEISVTNTTEIETAGNYCYRLKDGKLTVSAVTQTATIAGTLKDLGYGDWKPADTAADMAYVGGGWWFGELSFSALGADTPIEYKVAMDHAWTTSYGEGAGNISVTIPAGRKSFKVLLNQNTGKVYDDVSRGFAFNGESVDPFTGTISIVGPVRETGDSDSDWDQTATGWECENISYGLYIYEKTFASAGSYNYKVAANCATWASWGDKTLTTIEDNTKVVFIYDITSDSIYNSINDASIIDSLFIGSSGEPAPEPLTQQAITVHFNNSENWDEVAGYMGATSSFSTMTYKSQPVYAYVSGSNWPGAIIEKDPDNDGWYSFKITTDPCEFALILNNNDNKNNNDNGKQQTENIFITPDKEETELWITLTSFSEKWTVAKTETAPDGWVSNTKTINPPVDPYANVTCESPIVNDDGSITFNLVNKEYSSAEVMGTVPGCSWTPNNAETGWMMELDGDVYTYTTAAGIAPGVYEYKFVVNGDAKDGWIGDPENNLYIGEVGNSNNAVVVPGLANAEVKPEKGQATELPTTLKLYTAGSKTGADTPVTYTVDDSELADVVTIDNTNHTITVPKACTSTEFTLTATTVDGKTSKVYVKPTERVYTYTIYYYDGVADHRDATKADMWFWEIGSEGSAKDFTEETISGNVWLKTVVQTPATDIGFIARSKGKWADQGGWQTPNMTYTNDDQEENVTLYVTSTNPKPSKVLPTVEEARERYILVSYKRANDDYSTDTTGWNFYSWNTGYGAETEIYGEMLNGEYIMKAPIRDSKVDFKLAFIVRNSEKANGEGVNKWIAKDGGDTYVDIPADQEVVKVYFEEGKSVVRTLPYNKSYDIDGPTDTITFYYRDDAALIAKNSAELNETVKVVVDGTEYTMTFDADNERYYYALEECEAKDYTFSYKVGDKAVEDKFASNGKVTYKSFDDLYITAELIPTEDEATDERFMDYNDNRVLKVEFAGNDASLVSNADVESITANLTVLGLGDNYSIAPELMEGTISVDRSVSAGQKLFPVVLKDKYGNVYENSVKVTVTERDADAFDWDEAVIYMTCTDRFYDGSTDNNTGVDKTDTLGYHGGDFVGLTAKLDYLKELGVNTIWITPIVQNSNTDTDNGYHGYWASDFTKLSSYLGTEEQFKTLLTEAHNRNMKIMVDVVLNHPGYGTEDYFDSVLPGVTMIRDAEHTIVGDDIYGSIPDSGLPDFMTEDEDVRNQLIQWQVAWMKNYDIDYYRVDTVKHVETLTWQAFKNELTKVNPDFKMIGEYFGAGYASTGGELGTGTMDSLLDFDINDKAKEFVTGKISDVEKFYSDRNDAISNSATLGGFLSSHDENSFVDILIKEKEKTEAEALALAKVAAALQITAKGQVVIYYGEEIGQHGLNNWPTQSNRNDFNWTAAETQASTDGSMLKHYQKLLDIRNDYSDVFAIGTRTTIAASDSSGYDVFKRAYEDEELFVALNVKSEAQTVSFATGAMNGTIYKDLYSGETYTVKSGKVTVTIPAAADGGTVILLENGHAGYDVIVHVDAESKGYDTPYIYAFANDGSDTELTGALPGAAMTANGLNEGWYDYTLSKIRYDEIAFVFNGGSEADKTGDLECTLTDGTTEIWVTGDVANAQITKDAPEGWKLFEKQTLKLHYYNTNDWSTVAAYLHAGGEKVSAEWPGHTLTQEDDKWYQVTMDNVTASAFKLTMNDGGAQDTADKDDDLNITLTEEEEELWVKDGVVYTWNPDFRSPIVNGNDITFNYYNDSNGKVWLKGSFDGWGDGVEMTDPDGDGIVSCTITVQKGTYQYKFNLESGDWITDPKNDQKADDGYGKYNSVVTVGGLNDKDIVGVKKGVAYSLPTQLEFVKTDGTTTNVDVTYSLKNSADTSIVTLNGRSLTPKKGTDATSVELTATATVDSVEYTAKVTVYFLNENAVDNNNITLKLHYSRPDGNYTDWNAWIWSTGMEGKQYNFVNENGEMVATVKNIPGRTTTSMGYKIRLGEWKSEEPGGDQYIDLSDVVSGTVHYYVNSGKTGGTRKFDTDTINGSKIVSTSYDRDTNKVTVNISSAIKEYNINTFTIKCTSTNTDIAVTNIEKKSDKEYVLTLGTDISSLESLLLSYTITYDGYKYNLMTPNIYGLDEFEAAYTYTENDLGLTYTKNASTFKLWAPTADSVTVNIYSGGTAGTADKLGSYPMTGGTKAEQGVWTCVLNGDWSGKYYTYTVNVGNEVNEACDPYARTTGVNGKRAMILDLASTNPEGWDADKNAKRHDDMKYTDAVIYELHVRDLSIDSSSGVDSKYQGKFLGLTQTGTKTSGGNPTALDHMIDLGITHLHLIPVYDYGSVDETKLDTPQFNWGYDPVNYNVPEGSYSTNPYDGSVRVSEMKQMVKTLHDNNINVVMDVVYNHVYDAGTFSFNQIVPKYFSRTWDDGSYTNGSGCGNETASERSMVRKYIVDSILYWHDEYHIDGFRFDLVGLIDTVTIQQIVDDVHAIDPDIIFYGEGWDNMAQNVEPGTIMTTQTTSNQTDKFAFFNDRVRDTLAGRDAGGNGFIWGNLNDEGATKIENGYLGKSDWCTTPSDTVNYASCHDNYTLMDKINVVYARDFGGQAVTSYSQLPGTEQVKLNNLAASYYMLSLGIPLVHAGEDMLRIKLDANGNVSHNSYNSPDSVNKIRWSNLDTDIYADTVDYYQGLIAFRKNHESLRLDTPEKVSSNVSSYKISNQVIMYSFDAVEGEVSDGIITIYNASTADKEINIYDSKYSNLGIVNGDWYVCINADDAGTELLEKVGADGKVTVKSRSAMALVKIKSAETANYKVGDDLVDTDSVYTRNNVVTLKFADNQKDGITTGVNGVVALKATTNIPATLTWVSSNTNVATVDAQGRVTAVAEGSAIITVSTYHGVEATCVVTVTSETVEESIAIDKTELSLVAGESDTLVITISPAGTTATYESSDESVATIDETGKVTAVAAGSATVKATLANGQSVSCTVTVEAAPEQETVSLSKDTMSLEEGDSEKLVAVVTPAGTTVTFSSKNTNVATVDQYGNVTAVAEGSAEIIVVTSTGKTAICTVTVTKPESNQGGSEPGVAEPEPSPSEPEPTPTPNPVPSTPDSDATTGAGNGAAAGVNPGATTTTPTEPAPATPAAPTTPKVEEEEEATVEVETEAETEVPETVEEVTPVVDEKLQNAIANETEKILEDVLNEDVSEEVMTEETLEKVKEALENGDSIITEIIVDKLDEADVKAEVKEAFEKVLAESFKDKKGAETKIAQYLDLSVLLKTTQGQELGAVHKLSKEMTFTIAVPEELVKEGRTFVVLRMHEGVTTVLDTLMNADGTLSFKTDRFSEYALAYVDAQPEDATDDAEGTEGDVPSGATTTEEDGNNMTTFVVVGLVIVILVALAGIFFALKRKKNN